MEHSGTAAVGILSLSIDTYSIHMYRQLLAGSRSEACSSLLSSLKAWLLQEWLRRQLQRC